MEKRKIDISQVTSSGTPRNRKPLPVPWAVREDTGRIFTNTGEPITRDVVEVETLGDLQRISKHHGNENLIIAFDDEGICSVTIYDDYIE